jgi:Ion channel
MWRAVVTVTTVGYGDVYPTSVEGRIIAMVVMLFGIGFLSVLTATVASRFVKTERGDETEEILAALTRLEAEVADLKQQLVFSVLNAGDERGDGVLAGPFLGPGRRDFASMRYQCDKVSVPRPLGRCKAGRKPRTSEASIQHRR